MMSTLLIFWMILCYIWYMRYNHIARRWSPSLAFCFSSRSVQFQASGSSTIDFYCVFMILRCFTLEGALHGKTLWGIFGLSEMRITPRIAGVRVNRYHVRLY